MRYMRVGALTEHLRDRMGVYIWRVGFLAVLIFLTLRVLRIRLQRETVLEVSYGQGSVKYTVLCSIT